MSEEKPKIYERNPDTGEIRERDFDDYTGESVKIYREKKPEDFGTGKMIPTYSPDAPWTDERVNENKSGQLLNESENDEQENRQLSFPFE